MKTEVAFQLKGREYVISYPNVGEYYRIEAMKQALGRGFYNALLETKTVSAINALDMIDIQATFAILCPKLIEDLKVNNFEELGVKDFAEIRDIYTETVAPFLNEITKDLSRVKD